MWRAPGVALARDFEVQRALVVLPTVAMSRVGDIAVFQVLSFNQSTTETLAEALAEARRQTGGRLAGIVLDLRGNPGGLLDQAVSLADLFIRQGADRLDRRPPPREPAVFCGLGPRRRAAGADRRADQWRLRLLIGDRRGGLAGCRARRRDRQLLLRQRHGADRAAAAQ